MKWFLLFLVFLLVGCSEEKKSFVELNGAKINVEIADMKSERQQGLMFRKELGKNEGMLFVFEDEAPRYFWMKNTPIPLDIIFFDKDFVVVSYIEDMKPCSKEPCKLYSSEKDAMYALEVNTGFIRENNIKQGMTAKLWR